jgi:hypothetical protein
VGRERRESDWRSTRPAFITASYSTSSMLTPRAVYGRANGKRGGREPKKREEGEESRGEIASGKREEGEESPRREKRGDSQWEERRGEREPKWKSGGDYYN